MGFMKHGTTIPCIMPFNFKIFHYIVDKKKTGQCRMACLSMYGFCDFYPPQNAR